jgi:glutamate 5-kinase
VTAPRFDRPRRVVVKVGSSSLRTPAGRLDVDLARSLVDQLAEVRSHGTEVVLVSSGAVAAGLVPLGLDRRPADLPRLQAAASVGQGLLLHTYQDRFAHHGIACGQALLTPEDVVDRGRYLNARHTFDTLLGLGAVPVVNENDTVATEELRFGDNDRLAALVTGMIDARLLVLLTDVDGLLDGGEVVERIDDLAGLAGRYPTVPGSSVGSGGIASKLEAARIATFSAAHAVIANARRDGVVGEAIRGQHVGTWCPPARYRPDSRKLWIAFAHTPRGRVTVDAGAVRALTERGSSLLAVGITAVTGHFERGDAIDVLGPEGGLVARGLTAYDRQALETIRGRPSTALDPQHQRAVIHRDSLVVMT